MENPQTQENTQSQQPEIKPAVLDYDDLRKMIPFFDGKEKLCRWCMRRLSMDKVNKLHSDNCHTPGVPFVQGVLKDLDITLKIKNEEILKNLPEGGFITVSNHPFGALDGIMLIKIIGEQRPDFKVMVNMFLNHIGAMRPNFIDVDPLASDDPAKRAVSMKGIAEALRHVKEGSPIGFFPAGAVSKFKWTWGVRIQDRPWQPTIMRIIQKLNVPIIPIYMDPLSWKRMRLRAVVGERIVPDQVKAECPGQKPVDALTDRIVDTLNTLRQETEDLVPLRLKKKI